MTQLSKTKGALGTADELPNVIAAPRGARASGAGSKGRGTRPRGRFGVRWPWPIRQAARLARLGLSPVLTAIGRVQRARLSATCFIAVTGSCGKTTTKELIHAAVSPTLQGQRSPESRNRFLTVFLTLLRTRRRHAYCLQEMSANGPGSLAHLIELFQPRYGVVTTVGTDHYSAFRGAAAVALEKGRLVEALPPQGTAFLNADDEQVRAMRERTQARVVTFGRAADAHVRAEDIAYGWPRPLSFRLLVHGQDAGRVEVPLYTVAHLPDVLAALAVAVELGVPVQRAIAALQSFQAVRGRLQVAPTPGGVTFVGDHWKASLSSLPPALDFLQHAHAGRRWMVLGTLSDYPGAAGERYRQVARRALEVAEGVVFVGPNAHLVERVKQRLPERALYAFGSLRELAQFLEGELRAGDLVLVKGSGVVDHLERLILHCQSPITCWRHACGRTQVSCYECRLLRKPAQPA
jgi:UDP-N-acetylmuramoyl-tripeptide--D-alanyl-D-alanine ligase